MFFSLYISKVTKLSLAVAVELQVISIAVELHVVNQLPNLAVVG